MLDRVEALVESTGGLLAVSLSRGQCLTGRIRNAGLLLAHGAAVVDDKGSIVLLKVEKTTKGVELKPIGGGS